MASISRNGIVYINRGDSFKFKLPVVLGENVFESHSYIMGDNDAVYVGIMEPNQPFEAAILRKKLTKENQDAEGFLNIEFHPNDTVCLLPGKYYQQIKLALSNGDVFTIFDKTQFFITE